MSIRERLAEPGIRLALAVLAALAALVAAAIALMPRATAPATVVDGPITVRRALATVSARFGDTITAEASVLSDDRRVPPDTVALRADFRPYAVVGQTSDVRRRGTTTLREATFTLRCLTSACLPPANGKPVRFPPLRVSFERGGVGRTLTVAWPGLAVHSQLSGDPLVPVGIVDAPPALGNGTRVSAGLMRALFALAAISAGLAGALLVLQALWPTRFYSLREWRRLTPLGQAMAQVDAAARIEDEGLRRQVLDRLAGRLDEAGALTLGREARGLAWGPATPGRQELEAFAARVRATARSRR
ncbi:MAG: hypothetical protein U0R50_10625 [Gaiellales bacterium]